MGECAKALKQPNRCNIFYAKTSSLPVWPAFNQEGRNQDRPFQTWNPIGQTGWQAHSQALDGERIPQPRHSRGIHGSTHAAVASKKRRKSVSGYSTKERIGLELYCKSSRLRQVGSKIGRKNIFAALAQWKNQRKAHPPPASRSRRHHSKAVWIGAANRAIGFQRQVIEKRFPRLANRGRLRAIDRNAV